MLAIERMPHRVRSAVLTALLSFAATTHASTGNAIDETEQLIGLSLEELLQVEVTSLSRKPQSLSSTAAAVFVVTQADIRQSGARTIPTSATPLAMTSGRLLTIGATFSALVATVTIPAPL